MPWKVFWGHSAKNGYLKIVQRGTFGSVGGRIPEGGGARVFEKSFNIFSEFADNFCEESPSNFRKILLQFAVSKF